MKTEDALWFPSAVDAWVRVVLLSVPAVAIGTLVVSIVTGEGIAAAVLAAGFIAVLYGVLVHPVRYGLDDTQLTVRFGLIRRHLRYDQISAVRPTRNPLSSPALSLDRLRVEYGRGFLSAVMISPAPRDEFLDELARRAGLERRGDVLVRPGASGAPS